MARRLLRFFVFKLTSVFLGLGFFALCAESVSASSGQNALDFLDLPMGAYSASLGRGNFAGIIGPEAIFLNPALLGQQTGAFASHQELLMDTRTEAIAAAIKMGHGLTLGGAAFFLDNGKIEGYSVDDIKTGTVNCGDRLLRMALAARRNRLSIGLSISYYNQRLAELIGNGWGLGAGMSLDNGLRRLAITVDNIGPKFRIGHSSAPLPGKLAFSAWIPIHNNMIDLSFDLIIRHRQKTGLAAGLEYHITRGLALRTGGSRLDPLSFGFRFATGTLAFDYSYMLPGPFGERHIFSATILK